MRPIQDLKVATVLREIARLCATLCDFPRLSATLLSDVARLYHNRQVNDRQILIYMISFFFVPRPSATFCDFGPQGWPRLCKGQVQDRHDMMFRSSAHDYRTPGETGLAPQGAAGPARARALPDRAALRQ
jgi:hypothetical protein